MKAMLMSAAMLLSSPLLLAAENAETLVARADSELNKLIQSKNVHAAAPFYAKDFVLQAGGGARKDKTQMLFEIGSPDLHLNRNETLEVHVRILGATAVLTGLLHQAGSWQGKNFDSRLRVTDTWVLQGERWVLLAGHASLETQLK